MGYLGRAWRDSLRLLPAMVVSASILRRNHAGEKPHAARCLGAREVDSGDHGGCYPVDGHWLDVITARTAAASQDVIDQVEPQRPYEAAAPNRASPIGRKPPAKRDSSSAVKALSTERLGTR